MVDFFKLGGYLATVDEDLWVWDDKAETVQWAFGRTIGFRLEFEAVVERLWDGGLPPFGAIVLLMAACRGDMNNQPGSDPDNEPTSRYTSTLYKHLQRIESPMRVRGLFEELSKVFFLPQLCRTPLKAKVALVEEILGGVKDRTRPRESTDFFDAVHQRTFSPITANRAITTLMEGLAKFEAHTWPPRFRTGIDDAPAPAEEIELPESAPANANAIRQLIDELRHDRELSAVASVARDLLAVAYLPRPMGSREELPIGGVSDISNRGSLHQLLIAELANDDFTLAMRISQGEALYLRREDPPTPPPGDRVLVIDSGLRMWGVPRVYATSVSLALAATTARNGEWKAFRIEGNERFPVDLGSRTGVLEHLERLSPALSPMAALQEIYREAAAASVREVVLITAEETAVDPEIVAELPTERGPTLFVASVSRDGEFKLREPRRRGSEPLAVARLDVGSLATVNRAPLQVKTDPRLPPIFSTKPFPLLLPIQPNYTHAIEHPLGGVVGLLSGGGVVHWPKPKWGAIELVAQTGKGVVRCFEAMSDGSVIVVRYHSADEPVTMATVLPDGEIVTAELASYLPFAPLAFLRGRTLFLADDEAITAFDPFTGRMEGKLPLNEERTKAGKHGFFRHMDHWYYPTIKSGKLLLLRAFDRKPAPDSEMVEVFRPPHREIVIALLATGDYWSEDVGRWNLEDPPVRPYELGKLSHDGRFSEIVVKGASRRFIVDHDTRKGVWEYHGVKDLPTRPSTLGYRTRIDGIGFDDVGMPVLSVPGGRIVLQRRGSDATWTFATSEYPRMNWFNKPTEGSRGDRPSLRRAKLSGTREAILDKRGILHFFDSSGVLPDVTITLFTKSPNAAWSSRLGSVGNPYCFGDRIPYPNDWTPFLAAIAQYGKGE
jgi:hypothetical protein